MQKIIPSFWYDTQAKEAAEFYTSIFPDSKITHISKLNDNPSGIIDFTVWGCDFVAISAGPYFKLNPSISLMVNFDPSQDKDAKKRLDTVWAKLMEGGKALMPLDKYPFSDRYGWVEDKFGLSWQLILTNPDGEKRPSIMPSMLFVGGVCGKAEQASELYLSVFKNAKRGAMARYGAGQEPDKQGSVMFTDFTLAGQWFVAMDSAHTHAFGFNEAFSFLVNCKDQAEIDYYWEKLSAVPDAEQCGWLKDPFGVSWQIVPTVMTDMMRHGTPEQIERVTQAFMQMKKLDLAKIVQAYEGS